MFKKLFGGAEKKEPELNVAEERERLQKTLDDMQLRQKVLETQAEDHKKKAKEEGLKKNKRGALLFLRKSKMVESELAKMDGQIIALETQINAIVSLDNDVKAFDAMKHGNKLFNQVQNKINIDEAEDIQEQMRENQDRQDEINQHFIGIAEEGQEELNDELEAMMAEAEIE